MKHRDYSLDLIKAFAIYLVIMDHLISGTDGIDNPFRTFIYSCHMPLFFFVSGILAYKKIDSLKNAVEFFSKKCRLLIPVFVFGLGNVIILNQNVEEFLIWHKFGLWFLWTLFLFFTIYTISQAVLIKNKNRYIEILSLLIPALICLCLRKFKDTGLGGAFNFLNLYNYVFFLAGVMIKRYDTNRLITKDSLQVILFSIYVIGLTTGLPALNIPMKLCGVLFAYMVSLRLTTNWRGDNLTTWQYTLMKVGQSSLFIYVLHYYFIRGIRHLPETIHSIVYSSPCYYLLIYSFIAIFIIFACTMISEILRTNKYIRLIAFGIK